NTYDEQDEAKRIAEYISSGVHAGFSFGDHAVLYRMNAQSNAIERALVFAGIPYRVIGGHRFYERQEIKDALAYLTVINNCCDDVRLRRIVNVPKRGIGNGSVDKAAEIAAGIGSSLFEVMEHADEYEAIKRSAAKMKSFCSMIRMLQDKAETASLDELFRIVIEETKYIEYLHEDKEKGSERIENINELSTNLMNYSNENDEPTLEGFLEEVALMTDIDNYNTQSDAVVLMTLHSAKGLEFPVVFIPGMEEGIFPSGRSSFFPEEVEEERRLAYVGITRAKKKLYLLHANKRMLFGYTNRFIPSRFVNEIPAQYIERVGRAAPAAVPFGSFGGGYAGLDDEYTPYYKGDMKKGGYVAAAKKKPAPAAAAPKAPGVKYNVGDTVVSNAFGQGVVLSVKEMANDSMLEIAFEKAGTKKLMANYAKLQKI
ncbi:MAG: ATP-dependent DNA helicase PcrA, partial [Clostridia bacterium]|nr:ATP-dependent DNA helicase PcrA [Clostridia bacterium]